jgi:hypothetical protein
MIRLGIFVLIAAGVLATILHINIWIALVPLAAFVIYAYTAGGLKTRCPACQKRLRIGASACPHCGQGVTPTSKTWIRGGD